MKTTVNPIGSNEYDIDDGVYLTGYSDKEIEEWPAPSTVHGWIVSAVEGHTKSAPVDKATCVRVVYAAGYHIDYPIYIVKENVAYLAHKDQGWIESDPKAFKDWFVQKVKENDEQLRRLVKYLKAWKEYKKVPLKGIEITILATDNFECYEGRDDKSLKNTVGNIISFLEDTYECRKPVTPKEDLFEGHSETKKSSIKNKLSSLKKDLEQAIDEEDPFTASEYVIGQVGERFPEGEKLESKREDSIFERTQAPGVLRNNGRSA